MNKLGFAIKIANEGVKSIIECNKGEWSNKVVDIREYLKFFSGLQGTSNAVMFMSFDKSGCFLTVFRSIPGRVGDFSSAWIYIPNSIKIETEYIESTIKFVKGLLSESNLSDKRQEIEDFFAKGYPKKEIIVTNQPCGNSYAFRYVGGDYTLSEILDGGYQKYYSEYKVIFLLDKNGDVCIADGMKGILVDLTDRPIKKICAVKAPSPKDLDSLGRGVSIVYNNHHLFVDTSFEKGTKLRLFLNRDGFEPIPLPLIEIENELQTIPLDLSYRDKWKKKISCNTFRVVDAEGNDIEEVVTIKVNGVTIKVNGKDLYQTVLLPEKECLNVKVDVKADGYEECSQYCNLSDKREIKIYLRRAKQSHRYFIKMSNGKVAEMTLSADELPRKTPLKWYYVDKVNKRSKPTMEPFPLMAILISLLVTGAIIGFVTCWLWFNVISKDSITETGTETAVEIGVNDKKATTTPKQSGREYLENKDVWKKSEMEKIPDLKGLFDALNTYNKEKINELCEGKEFGGRMDTIISTLTKIEGNLPNTSYCTDEKINFENYIKKLKKSIKSKYPETRTRDTSKIGNQGEL